MLTLEERLGQVYIIRGNLCNGFRVCLYVDSNDLQLCSIFDMKKQQRTMRSKTAKTRIPGYLELLVCLISFYTFYSKASTVNIRPIPPSTLSFSHMHLFQIHIVLYVYNPKGLIGFSQTS